MTLPLCLCGCGERVRRSENRYASHACVPKSLRLAGIMKGRRNFAYRRRALFFRAEHQRLTAAGGRLTTEDLLETFARVYERGYANGHQTASKRWRAAQRRRGAAA